MTSSSSPLIINVGNPRTVSFKVDAEVVRRVIAGAPKIAYFWTRDFLGRSFGRHRVQWLRSKSTKFGRGGADGRAIKVSQINESTGALGPNEVRYSVHPAEKKMATRAAATDGLAAMSAVIETGNNVLPVHEFGTDIRSSKPMFIPVKTRPGNFRRWRALHPEAKLLRIPSKRDDKTLIYEQRGVRGKPGRPRKGEGPPKIRLRLRWVLTKFVSMRPTLRLYDSWDVLSSERDKLWGEAATKMHRDLQKGDLRDL